MPAKQNYTLKSGARAATKNQEKDLIERAERLYKKPALALPECKDSCWFCPIKSGLDKMVSVRKAADDEKKLEKLSESGNDFAMAYAGMLLIRKKGKVSYVFSAKTPFGELVYAVRGNAKKERQIGMQNFDHPRARLVTIMDIARDRRLHVYAFDDRMVCCGKSPVPPPEFVEFIVGQLEATLEKDGRNFACRHLQGAKKSEMIPTPHIEVEWRPAGTTFKVCEKCAKENTLLSILTRMLIPAPRVEFDFRARGGFECQSRCENCRIPVADMDKETYEKYLHGALDDKGLIDKQTMKCLKTIREGQTKVYILGKKCFGKDLNSFINAMNPTEEERVGLEAVLSRVKGPVIVEGETASKVLETFWDQYGQQAMEAACGDRDVACTLLDRYKTSKMSPTQLLKEAIAGVKQKEIIAKLPVYRKLHPVARFADEIARIYFTRGKDDAARAIERYNTEDNSVKSTAYALLLAMGMQTSRQWLYLKEEVEFADYLRPHAEKFLSSTPKNYHESLQALLSATGSTEQIQKP